MNWYSVALAAMSGGLAALLARLFFGGKPENRRIYIISVVLLFVLFNTLTERYILPKINAHNAKAEIEAVFEQTPAFATIKEYEPAIYQQIVATLVVGVEKGHTQQELIDLARLQVSGLVAAKMPHASDDAVLTYMQVMLTELEELQVKGNGLCYKLLFPEVDGGVDGLTVFTEETRNKDFLALIEIIKTSSTKRAIPAENEVMPFLEPILVAMHEKYGDDISVLENPTAPNTDQETVCVVTMELYSEILELPPKQAASTLRWMLGQGQE